MRRVTGATEPNAKQVIRERMWDRLQRDGASRDPHPLTGRAIGWFDHSL